MVNVIGHSCSEKAILSNKRYTSEEALSIGMVDKVVPKDKVMEETKSELEKWVKYSGRTVCHCHPLKPANSHTLPV